MVNNVEMFEGTYKDIWSLCVKYPELNNYWKKNVHKVSVPVIHYTIAYDSINEILLELLGIGAISQLEEDRLRNNLFECGYVQKTYGNISKNQKKEITKTKNIKNIINSNGFIFIETVPPKDLSKIIILEK